MDNDKNNSFSYTYSAKETAELSKIREKYSANEKEESKIERVRRLDKGVTKKATSVAIALGVIGSLILGFGMCLIMTEISSILGKYESNAFIIGLIIGTLGIITVSIAYPVYNAIVKKEKAKIAPEILRLTEELLK